MEIMHPDTPYTPWISMQPQLCYPAAARLLEMPPALAVGSVTLPDPARPLLCSASPHMHASRPPGCKDACVSWCPNLAPSPGGSTAEALPGIPKSGFALGGQELGGLTPIGRACQHYTVGSGAAEGQRERRGQRKAEGLIQGGCSRFGGCPGGASPLSWLGAARGCRGAGGDRRAPARLLVEHCLLLPLERAGTSHAPLSPSQVPPPRCPCAPWQGRGWAAPSRPS